MRSKPKQTIDASGLKVTILVSSYHDDVTTKLLDGAKTTFVGRQTPAIIVQGLDGSAVWLDLLVDGSL